LVRLIATFAGSGLIWVIGTIRADFFHRCGEVPGFSALKDGLSSYELLPPTGPEIAQIIREPARAAGLRFEETAGQGRLEDVLQEEAAVDPGSLPLLQFVLDALSRRARSAGSPLRRLSCWAVLKGDYAAPMKLSTPSAGHRDALPAVRIPSPPCVGR
jgi:hypothetical protein